MIHRSNKGITFIEVIISVVILVLISTTSWMAVTVLMKSGEMSRNVSNAVNILQKSQEELKRISRISQAFFDNLENCEFPTQGGSGDTCGFEDIAPLFHGFTRELEVTGEDGNNELKRALITVRWNEHVQERELYSIVLLARPPDPLPGNIIGVVKSASGQQGQIIADAIIRAELDHSTETHTAKSEGFVDPRGANFDFIDPELGRFVLTAGTWAITAEHDNYFTYTRPAEPPLIVESNQEVFITIEMEPKPDDATIQVRVVDQTSGNQLVDTFYKAYLSIYDDGALFRPRVYNQRTTSFPVSFENYEEQCFTLTTNNAYRAAYAAYPACVYNYDREGWSSSIYQEDNSLICDNPRNGNDSSDRICVNPGDDIVAEIPVSPVPEVNITGRVVDSNSNPISGAIIRAKWPRSDSDYWRKGGSTQTAVSQADGTFVFSVPAVQEMFPNSNPSQNYLLVWARASVQILSCCDQIISENRNSWPTAEVGPLFEGDPDRDIGDLVIYLTDTPCGDVTGLITDDFSTNPLSDAQTTIRGQDELTNGVGIYMYDCPEEGYRLRQGSVDFEATHNDFYEYHSDGNYWYASGPNVQIVKDEVVSYNSSLWPKGFGNVKVIVLDETTELPIPDANVVLTTYSDLVYEETTNSSGEADFTNIQETWPPAALPGSDPHYNYEAQVHEIEVSHDSGIYLDVTETLSELNDGDNVVITVHLATEGGL